MISERILVEGGVFDALKYIGEDPSREGLRRTPARVVTSWEEFYSGYRVTDDQLSEVLTTFDDPTDEMVIVKDIQFFSTCEHHMLPFFGSVAIGYIPDGKIIGVSKLARLVEVFARRLQVQERLTREIATAIRDKHWESVAVQMTGQHLCMMARGVRQTTSEMVTTQVSGSFKNHPETRAEFLAGIKRSI